MSTPNGFELISQVVAEGTAIAFVLCLLRSFVAFQIGRVEHAKFTALFALIFTTVVPYGGKLTELLLEGPNGDLASHGYTLTWLLTAMQGRMAGAAVGVAAFLMLATHVGRRVRAH